MGRGGHTVVAQGTDAVRVRRTAGRSWPGVGALVLAILLTAAAASAHTRSQSYSTWSLSEDGQVRLSFSVLSREATRLVALEGSYRDLGDLLQVHLARVVAVHADGQACTPMGSPDGLPARDGHLRVEWRFQCPPEQELELSIGSFFDLAPSHVHFARVRSPAGVPVEYLFTDSQRRHRVGGGAGSKGGDEEVRSSGATFLGYVELGFQHILAGLDHIAFLLALLLLSRNLREVILMVTGFTVGHSITLSLAALGWVEPNVPIIEALIGFTIAIVAAEVVALRARASRGIANLGAAVLLGLAVLSPWLGVGPPVRVLVGLALFTFCYLRLAQDPVRATKLSPLLTGLFGLIHGFGFANVLIEIGLPAGRLVPALFGFNVGVELGQLAIVAIVWGGSRVLLRSFANLDWRPGVDVLAATLCGLGTFWFVERAFGG